MTTMSAIADNCLSTLNVAAKGRQSVSGIIRLGPGECVYQAGERAASIYQVQAGAVRVYCLTHNGHRHILSFYGVGEWFGLQDAETHEDFAEAVCDTQIRCAAVASCMAAPIDLLGVALTNLAAARARQLLVIRPSAIERVAAFVQEMAARNSGAREFELMMSRSDIADYLGLTVESVARSFTKLRTSRVIHLQGRGQRQVRILNPQGLAALGA